MKIYKGPSTKDYSDSSHELVDTRDLSKSVVPWVDSIRYQFNVTKNSNERQSVATIVFDAEDIEGLYRALLIGREHKKLLADKGELKPLVKCNEDTGNIVSLELKKHTRKLPCISCGARILPETSLKTGGKCIPCSGGRWK